MSREGLGKKMIAFWKHYESKIILIFGFSLVAVISFEAGIINSQGWQKEPIVIEKPASAQLADCSSQKAPEAPKTAPEGQNKETISNIIPADCAFVGSKNSNKYHLPTCRWAKQIKPENLVCFKSIEEAVQKGYQPDKNCNK